jgi:hypothetical protein
MLNVFNPAGPVQIGNSLVHSPTAGRTVFVHHNLPSVSELPPGMHEMGRTSVQNALLLVRTGRADVIQLLPGHTESIAIADAWSNLGSATGVVIKGPPLGPPAVFTWTTATSTLKMDTDDLVIDGSRSSTGYGIEFHMAGPTGTTALTVAAPLNISGARNVINGCKIEVGIDGDQLCTDAIVTTAAADDLVITNNWVYGNSASELTTLFKFVGADRLLFSRNIVTGALATDTEGLLTFVTTASTGITIADNLLHANGTLNETNIAMAANIVVTGWLVRNFCRNMTDTNNNYIVTSGTGVDVQLMDNYGINNSNERGLAEGTASA